MDPTGWNHKPNNRGWFDQTKYPEEHFWKILVKNHFSWQLEFLKFGEALCDKQRTNKITTIK